MGTFHNAEKVDIFYPFELSEEERETLRQDYRWMDEEEFDYADFFKFRGNTYSTSDFMAVNNSFHNPHPPAWQSQWDGYLTDTFFSAILIKIVDDGERVIVAEYF